MMTRGGFLRLSAAVIASATASIPQIAAQSVEAFYRDRTITLIIPTAPGGINNLSGRLVARHLGRFIPGKPTILVLLQFGRACRHPLPPDVPLATELTRDKEALDVIASTEAPLFMALPFLAPAGIPADRAAALRNGFMAMVKDRDFLVDAERAKLDITPIDGVAVRNIIVKMATTPKDVIARYNQITGVTN